MEDHNIIRITIVLISGMCIYFGYRLFYIVTERQGKIKIEGGGSNVELSDVGPGIFFSLFGAIVLIVIIIYQPYKDKSIKSADGSIDITIREPANTFNQYEYEFESLQNLCVSDEYEDGFMNALELMKATESLLKSSKFMTVSDIHKNKLILILRELNYPDELITLTNEELIYLEYFYFLKSSMYLIFLSNGC